MRGEFAGDGLSKESSCRRKQNDWSWTPEVRREVGSWKLENRFARRKDRLRFHDHTAAAAVGRVVGDVVFVRRIVADVVQADGDQIGGLRAFEDAFLQVAVEHGGEEGE